MGAKSAGFEREVKLQAPAGFRLPELGGGGLVSAPGQVHRTTAVYFDTPDLQIARWGCSLRYRDTDGWTVKLSPRPDDEVLQRSEHVFEGANGTRKPPTEAVDLLRAYVRERPLAPVARLRTVRRSVDVADELGRPVAVVTDDEVSVMDGRRVASRFREIEVELAPGSSEEILGVLVERLREAGAGPVENVPKLRRALGAKAETSPEVVVPSLGDDPVVADVIRRALAASVVRLLDHDAGVRLGADPEDVHQARVATRRLRSDLRTFRDALEPRWSADLRDELRWVGAELGAVRDAEVLRDRLRSRVESLPSQDRRAADALIIGLERVRERARERLLGAMREPRYLRLLDALVQAARAPSVLEEAADVSASSGLRVVLDLPWKHLVSAMEAVEADPSDQNLHAARIRAKRVRYAAEAVGPVFGKQARRFTRSAVRVQDVLGEHQDAVVARAWLREAATSGDALVAGELMAMESQAATSAREDLPAAWKALSRKRLRFWA